MLELISNFDLNNAINQYMRDYDEYNTISKLWDSITRISKKDGSDFSIISKNFVGCTFNDSRYTKLHAAEKEITVAGQTETGRYVSACINNYECIKYTKLQIDESRIIKEPCLEPYFYYTVDELTKLFKETAAKYKKWADESKQKAETAAAAAELYNKKIIELNQELKINNFPFDAYDIQRFGK